MGKRGRGNRRSDDSPPKEFRVRRGSLGAASDDSDEFNIMGGTGKGGKGGGKAGKGGCKGGGAGDGVRLPTEPTTRHPLGWGRERKATGGAEERWAESLFPDANVPTAAAATPAADEYDQLLAAAAKVPDKAPQPQALQKGLRAVLDLRPTLPVAMPELLPVQVEEAASAPKKPRRPNRPSQQQQTEEQATPTPPPIEDFDEMPAVVVKSLRQLKALLSDGWWRSRAWASFID